ncbi:hypothetical protein [Myroides odoratimimus]|uniref:AbiTii domain-containing protein n=1 Tax=Myroides odoratimimus TaxID=76832 RepID=UPI00091B3958|nr:hypothetical protein [Myroides odoratimimus]SHL61472.1 hypothetical protein SAMN05444275_105185 [Myroides odoratimimus subsp. xuanwuensis]
MKQIFLLQEVIDDLVNTEKSLSAPLMKLNYFGRLINNQELIDYTQNELNGYHDQKKVPNYRKTIGTLFIDMQMYINRHSGQLPISMLDEPYQDALKYVYVKEGIAAIEKLAREAESGDSNGQIMTPLPMEMLHILQTPARKLYKSGTRVDVIGARLLGNANIVVEIPNAIRTRLLEFSMSIAEMFGYDIEIESFNKRAVTNNKIIIYQMNTTINNSGDGNVINTGNQNQIENKITLYKGDIERLQRELITQGIDENDIIEITEIIQAEQPDLENGRLGEKSNSWISKIINKSLNGIGKIATEVSANLLVTLVKQYYGME